MNEWMYESGTETEEDESMERNEMSERLDFCLILQYTKNYRYNIT